MALLGPTSNVMFRVGMERVGTLTVLTPTGLVIYGWKAFTNEMVAMGIVVRILFTAVSMLVLSWADYSFVTPVSAINYAIVAVMGYSLLGEKVTPMRWAGIALICLGVGLLGTTPASTTVAREAAAAES